MKFLPLKKKKGKKKEKSLNERSTSKSKVSKKVRKRTKLKDSKEKTVPKKKKTHNKKGVKKSDYNPKIEKMFEEAKLGIKKIEWTPKISVNNKIIDEQHKNIISEIDELRKAIVREEGLYGVRRSIHFLDEYIKEHLVYEEMFMEKIGYPEIEKHKKIHRGFIKFYEKIKNEFTLKLKRTTDVKQLSEEYSRKLHDFLGNWWINHIGTIDHKYAEYVAKKNKSGKKVSDVLKSRDFDIAKIKSDIGSKLKTGKIHDHEAQILEQRAPAKHVIETLKEKSKKVKGGHILTGVPGFDDLLEEGIPQGSSVLVAGGAGSGKTIFCLQLIMHHAINGKKCFYMSFEESEERLMNHINDFGWDAKKFIKSGKMKIKRYSPFEITRSVDAMLAKEKGELLIDLDPVILPEGFKPDFIILDSLTAIASAFTGKEDSYRIYIEQLFRFFEKMKATAFLITETKQIPEIFSTTGVEEFLADGVIVIYNIKRGNIRESAIEILKMRGERHQKKIVAMQITGKGIIVYPEQEVFGGVER